jgi:hypothetical protein
MRLVDGEQRERGCVVQQAEEARRQQALGRHVEQVELAREQRALDRRGFARVQRRIQEGRAHAELAQRATWSCISAISGDTTIARCRAQQRRHLVAQRLAAAGGHQHQRIAARSDRPHYCAYVAQAFGDPELRIDCNEHEAAIPAAIEANAARFRQPVPP